MWVIKNYIFYDFLSTAKNNCYYTHESEIIVQRVLKFVCEIKLIIEDFASCTRNKLIKIKIRPVTHGDF